MSTDEQIAPRARVSHFRQAMMALFWFGIQAHWAAYLTIILPQQAIYIGGDAHKGETQGWVLLFVPIVSMVVAPLFGSMSDRIVTPFGRRRPWILAGTLLNIIGLFGLAYLPRQNDLSSLPIYIAVAVWVCFWNNFATAPYNALIPDIMPPEQRGSAAGWYGLMSMLGNAAGVGTGILFTAHGKTDITAIYYFIAVLFFLSMVFTVVFVQEPRVVTKPPPFQFGTFIHTLLDPLRDHDFRWVFWTRFMMVMGFFVVQQYLQYYFRDVVRNFTFFGVSLASNEVEAFTVFGLMLLIGAVISSLSAGILSDRFGRKLMVYISSALQAVVPIVFIFFTNYSLAVILGIVFGLGYGAYQSVDWALASDVLPSEDDYAKDMGVWHVAFTLPQLAVFITGFVLDGLQSVGRAHGNPNLPYMVIFAFAVICFILGTVLVRRIKKVR
ncbi:MAG TPA: MFS transporter [Anaerolineales bacterium]|nr:MFS transporter [Anaerolineales bacterium]